MILPPALLEALRGYWRVYHPTHWLFPGKEPTCPLSVAGVSGLLQLPYRDQRHAHRGVGGGRIGGVSLPRLSPRQAPSPHAPGGRGAHPPLPAARVAEGVMRIRHYGFLVNRCRREKLAAIRSALSETLSQTTIAEPEVLPEERGTFDDYPCPRCGEQAMRVIGELASRRLAGGYG